MGEERVVIMNLKSLIRFPVKAIGITTQKWLKKNLFIQSVFSESFSFVFFPKVSKAKTSVNCFNVQSTGIVTPSDRHTHSFSWLTQEEGRIYFKKPSNHTNITLKKHHMAIL